MTENDGIEDILFDLLQDGQFSDDAVASAIADNPQHEEDIRSFVALWREPREDDRATQAPLPPPDLSRLWDKQAQPVNPFAGRKPAELTEIAMRCGVPTNIMVKVVERLLEATSVPMLLIRRLAAELQVDPTRLLEHLDQRQVIGASDFRSDRPPVIGQKQSFADAVRSSGMSDDLKQKWLDLSE